MTIDTDALRQVVLEQARMHLRRYVSPEMARRVTVDIIRDPETGKAFADMLVADIAMNILTEHLPPQNVTRRVQYQHPEAIGETFNASVPVFATWFGHFCATVRGRWWAKLLLLHKHEIAMTFKVVSYQVTMPVQCDHQVTIDIQDDWHYPKASTTIRNMGLGEPVLYSMPSEFRASPAVAAPEPDTEVVRKKISWLPQLRFAIRVRGKTRVIAVNW